MKFFGLNIDTKKISDTFKSLPKKKDLETRPSRDWALIVVSFFILVIIIGVSNYFIYKREVALIESATVSPTTQNLNKEQINKVIEFFDKKEKEFTQTLNSTGEVKDPSI